MLRDTEVVMEIESKHPIETQQYDFETGNLLMSGGNPQIEAPRHPLLVKSKYALNQKRVLWLRDSFGVAISPYMAATFAETLQLHYALANPVLFAQLVDTYKPDYVFITVVERDARSKWFENLPPLPIISAKQKNFVSQSKGTQSRVNNMTKVEGSETYRITSNDPAIIFTLSNPVRTQDVSQLVFELNCGEKKDFVQVQVFWHSAGSVFSEANSASFTTKPGTTAVDLSLFSAWVQEKEVTDVRIDIDSPGTCPVLAVNSLELGNNQQISTVKRIGIEYYNRVNNMSLRG